jgi:hypothetical protein
MKAVAAEENRKTVFVAYNKVNDSNKWTDQKYIDEKLQCTNILCNMFFTSNK